MKLKKLLATLMATVLMLTVATGCTSNDTGTKKDPASNTGKEETVNLKFYMNGDYAKEEDRIMEKANKIIGEKINAKLEFVKVAEYSEKMNMMINSGETFDLCFSANWGGINYFENAAKGGYYDLTDIMQEYAPQSYSRIPESLWDGVKVNGKIFGVVNYQQWGAASRSGIGLRKDLVDEFKFDYASLKNKRGIDAFKGLEPFLQKVKEKYPTMIPFEYENKADTFVGSPIYFGMEPVGDTNMPGWVGMHDGDSPKVINQFATDEYAAYVKMMREWFTKGYVKKDAATMKDVKPDREAARIASCRQGGWPDSIDFPNREMHMPNTDTGGNKKSMVVVSVTETMLPAGKPSESVVAIGANSKNPIKALQLIELLNTNDELYRLITLGEENVDWEYAKEDNAEKGITTGDYVLIPNKYSFNWCEWQIGQSYSPTFERSLFSKNEKGEVAKEAQKIVYEADKTALKSPVSGFTFNTEPVKTEYAQCSAIVSEMVPALGSGSVDPNKSLPDFLNRLEKAGVSKIIAEKQKQIDAWKAASK